MTSCIVTAACMPSALPPLTFLGARFPSTSPFFAFGLYSILGSSLMWAIILRFLLAALEFLFAPRFAFFRLEFPHFPLPSVLVLTWV